MFAVRLWGIAVRMGYDLPERLVPLRDHLADILAIEPNADAERLANVLLYAILSFEGVKLSHASCTDDAVSRPRACGKG